MIPALNRKPWFLRWPLKLLLILLFALLVCFPRLDRLVTSITRYLDPSALIEPDAPALQPWIAEFRATDNPAWTPALRAKAAERFVYQKLPYEWDWNLWANADYFPTVTEAITRGREDCDGRAIVAASMLHALDIDAKLMCNFVHVWVATPNAEIEIMGPPQNASAVLGDGKPINLPGLLNQLLVATGYSLSVFPLSRLLLILLFAGALFTRPPVIRPPHLWRFLAGMLLAIAGLLLLRNGGNALAFNTRFPIAVLAGFALLAAGLFWTAFGFPKPRSKPGRPKET